MQIKKDNYLQCVNFFICQHQKDMQKQLDESNAKHGDANKSNDSLTQELRNLASTVIMFC